MSKPRQPGDMAHIREWCARCDDYVWCWLEYLGVFNGCRGWTAARCESCGEVPW